MSATASLSADLSSLAINEQSVSSPSKPLPTVFFSHGGGPCFFMDGKGTPFEAMDRNSAAAKWYKQLAKQLQLNGDNKPKALLVISAHWESKPVKVTTQANPGLLFDYYGFPPETYELEWKAPGHPALADKVMSLLTREGIPCEGDNKRNYDHGVFIPLKLVYPDADIPTIQLSLHPSLDPSLHLKIGRALAPLREEGVLIIGSGFIVHDLSFRIKAAQAKAFCSAMEDVLLKSPSAAERDQALIKWADLPYGKQAHPREEHLIPLLVAAAAAGDKATAKKISPNGLGAAPFLLDSYAFE